MSVIFVTCSPRFLTVKHDPLTKVSTIKTLIRQNTHIQEHDQYLSYRGKPLQDNRMLQEYGIENQAMLHLNIKIRGGMKDGAENCKAGEEDKLAASWNPEHSKETENPGNQSRIHPVLNLTPPFSRRKRFNKRLRKTKT